MTIVKEIDKLSGTDTRSHNITHAIDKLSGEGPSKNIMDAIKKVDVDPDKDSYQLTEDEEVVEEKTYYEKTKNGLIYEYVAVAEPTGNPKTSGWYEAK